MEWQDVWIREFKGESTKRNPEINECAKCENLDLRDKKGDLVMSPKISTKYAAPTVLDNWSANTYLGMDTFHVTKTTTRQEVLCQVQKGTVSKVTGSSSTVASKNILAFCIRPYWSGSAWVDAWKWLNRMYITSLTGKTAYVVTAYGITKAILDTEPHWIVYNVTQSKYANVLAVDASHNITISRNDFTNGDTVIVLTNFIPFTYLEAMYSTTKDELCFHKVDGELRIGFGGYENRLGIAIKYLKGYGCVDTVTAGAYTTIVNTYDEIILDPYNSITDGDAFSGTIVGTGTSSAGQGWLAGLDSGTNIFYIVTIVLDGVHEFAVRSAVSSSFSTTTERYIQWQPVISACANKRITNIKLYMALSHKDNNDTRATEYLLVSNKTVRQYSAIGTGWSIGTSGQLYSTSFETITKQTFESADQNINSYLNYTVNKADVTHTTVSTDYTKSWDRAIVSNGKTLVLNPYITAREVNKVYKSITKDNGAAMYDVIPAQDYISLDDKSGNDVRDMQLLPNYNLIVAKDNDIISVDPTTGASTILASGIGGVGRRGMTNFHTHFAIPSEYDVYMLSGNDYINITEDTIRDAYRAISDKTKILGVRDEYSNAFRMFDGVNTEYIFTPGFGWTRATITALTSLQGYAVDEDGRVLMLDSTGIIYYRDNASQYGTDFEWLSVPIDIALINKQLIQQGIQPILSERFLIGGFFMKYTSSVDTMTITLYLNGSAYGSTITIPTGSAALANKPIPGFPPSCKYFQFKITGTHTTIEDMSMSAFGFKVKTVDYGRFG